MPFIWFIFRFEIESGILDEDGETDLENFLDANDLKDLGWNKLAWLFIFFSVVCLFVF